ncbi:hypothetical protein [Halobacterium salinarum]|uniref:DUF7981 domain-containing protein n=3 Tax=Halobacterium salinarum TaxID=2242 RepID=Q9HNH8_HALSA|nr:hypothetical protein [Halobacterium salinarum]AAG20242.1 hypothetical protein VNG_2098H [Halobacterium salinarum NRC-1]MBB6089259.1 hypothetical protein [Halobacterium salinarum]MDL0118177.1 hypothetical protein [Halobacterium salinarum]MDL0128413.1 hypothetical protein [Halobacterium salinarum]MDL0129745.1 hypothetical protein [Halobacterium salinarum]
MVAARTTDTLLWGCIAALAFLVLAQAYVLATGAAVPLPPLFGVALVVFAVGAATGRAARIRVGD